MYEFVLMSKTRKDDSTMKTLTRNLLNVKYKKQRKFTAASQKFIETEMNTKKEKRKKNTRA